MTWHVVAGLAQLVLLAVVALADLRARRLGDLLLFGVPMAALAVGTLLGVHWVVVVAAVFYSVWLLDQVVSWRRAPRGRPTDRPTGSRPKRSRRQPAAPWASASLAGRAVLGLVSLAVLAATWIAVTPAALT